MAYAFQLSDTARMHTVVTTTVAAGPAWEFHLTRWLCPRWEAWAGNEQEAERWRDEHLLAG